MTNELGKGAKISTAITPTAGVAASSDLNGSTISMAGFESVLMLVRMGAITGSAVTSIRAQQGENSDGSSMSDLTGTDITIADDDDDETFYLDIIKPEKEFVRVVVKRATQNAVVTSANYIQYRARKQPTTHGSAVTGETHVSPAEGTA